jgi:dipeptidyl aminopeptidase/acylaminoacyl peptidase
MGVFMKNVRMMLAALAWISSGAMAQEAAQAPASAIPRKIPTSEFAQQNLLSGPILSPDGKKIAARAQAGDKPYLLIHTVGGSEKPKAITLPENNELKWYRWAGNGRLLISLSQTIPWFGDEAEMTRLLRFNISDSNGLVLGRKVGGLSGDDLLYTDPSGEWILLSMQKSIYDYPSVFRVNLADNKMTEVVKQRNDVWSWYADNDGVVRAGIGFGETGWSMIYRKTADEKFRRLGRAKYDDEDAAFDIIRFARGSDDGFVLRNHETGRYALYKFNYATKQVGEKIFESPTNDITDFELTEDGSAVRSAWYTDDRDRIKWFDPAMKDIQAAIDAAVKTGEAWIISRTPDNSAMVVWTGASNNPGIYYYFQPSGGVMRRLATANAALKRSELAAATYFKYKARDGLEIPAYLTLPLGRPAKGLPLIIMPHGGPYGVRDRPDYDPEVQFLANRGYAVLQPNYRGSESYGKAFYEKGEGQWGRQMQDDLDDGMDWLAKEGTIDPKRVCIVGASYGGYAAAWGATRNPERYRCAASFAGVMDLGRQLKYQLDFGVSRRYRKDWRKTVQGDKSFDPKTVSPLYTIDKLTRPLLIAHGDADQTVPYKQSKLYADALQKAGKDVQFHTYPKEGHGLSNAANLQDWMDRLEAFLQKYNPAN